ncbi:SDR family oxidoreductase [Microbacterium sp. IEGM 1404]|uniref:SDR family oxidoreductase n=1 Tax=Microbacterium sp. IEGM 1404 TaxID=3047084 RepID=UPI0024B753F9|nr:SDR family oxidoreductase [Microbacterium sp. IEGM 1404]MDI9891271.1 SDR family oxidoreductase [Microbacterium sp. IEGM 1404]
MTDTDIPLPSLAGRRAVLTGGSDGMGLVIAERLAAAGAEVVLPVRNRAKGDRAARTIRERVPGARLELHDLDLSSLTSVADFAGVLRADGRPVHLLVNNAGVMTPPERQTTADGFELQFATNHLGHVALVGGILPLLTAGSARVVTQLSIAARSGRIAWDDLPAERGYDGQRVYSASKIALGLFARELDRRSAEGGWGLRSVVSHPGVAPSNLLAARPEIGRTTDVPAVRAIRWMSRHGILLGTVRSAAQPALLAATTTDPRSDVLYGPRGPMNLGGAPTTHALYRPLRDLDEARRVWDESQRLVGVTLG